jgi:hypothetical protein
MLTKTLLTVGALLLTTLSADATGLTEKVAFAKVHGAKSQASYGNARRKALA